MRKLPPPTRKPSKSILFVAVIVSLLLSLAVFAGVVWVGFWVAGESDALSFRNVVGFSVALFLYRIVDRTFARMSDRNASQGQE